ncbi:MAG: hypothetical protein GX369_06220 [Euryarchaeota archaeon]|nr:hypothetical protein [Euryarchaeota archaeon]
MQVGKILMIGAVGLAATLLFAGVVMATGPNGFGDNLASSDRHQLFGDNSDTGVCQEHAGACNGNHNTQSCNQCYQQCDDHNSHGQRNCAQHGASCEGDHLRLRDGSCHSR